jgi:hypothetical protein
LSEWLDPDPENPESGSETLSRGRKRHGRKARKGNTEEMGKLAKYRREKEREIWENGKMELFPISNF